MIEVKCDVHCYSVDGKETTAMNGARPMLSVTNEGLHHDRVTLCFDGKSVTVLARDLQAAVNNATNLGTA